MPNDDLGPLPKVTERDAASVRFVVCSPSNGNKASYCVLAGSLEEAVRLNAEQHPGDAECMIRLPNRRENIPVLTFDLRRTP
jgi:hypothetical protein